MAADLVTAAQLATHLGITDPGGGIFDALLEAVEAQFERDVARTENPFRTTGTITQVLDGTGGSELWLWYPINALTSLKLGEDTADPDETLDVTDLDVLRWAMGSRRVVRVDGAFGVKGAAREVHVVYTCLADLPADAAYAVKVMAGLLYANRGGESITSERLGSWSAEFGSVGPDSRPAVWDMAVANHLAVVA